MQVAETHISWVFFIDDRAYKLKKPVRTGFLDFTTVEGRALDCRREVDLNRRLAPDVYEGVATITGPDGMVCDHLVVMRRMPDERRLAVIVVDRARDVEARAAVLAVARRLASFHDHAERSPAIDVTATAAEVGARWKRNAAEMQPFAASILDAEMLGDVDDLAATYVAGRGPLFEERTSCGRAVDGHGDLLADDIFCLDDGPRVLDCLEFDDRLRWGDGLADAAFLAMDLERLGRADLAHTFLSAYRAASHDEWPLSLAHYYIAARAQVRSKVACLRAEQGARTEAQARNLLRLARDNLMQARVRLVVVGGLPGTGKSTLSAGLQARLGWEVVRSDVIRRSLAVGATAGAYRSGRYDDTTTEATYEMLLRRAEHAVTRGRTVILDASWSKARHRDAARQLAMRTHTELIELCCEAPADLAARRIETRRLAGEDPSEATPRIADAMAADADPWPSARSVDTTTPIDDVVETVVALVAPESRRQSAW